MLVAQFEQTYTPTAHPRFYATICALNWQLLSLIDLHRAGHLHWLVLYVMCELLEMVLLYMFGIMYNKILENTQLWSCQQDQVSIAEYENISVSCHF